MSTTEERIEVGTLQWFYREAKPIGVSDKLPVLLLHGLPSHSYSWCEIMPKLAEKGFWAIAPDWIGSGFSAKPDKREFAYTPDAYIEALKAFVEALQIEQSYLVVQGFLGSVGLQYALRYPEKIQRLAILNTPLTTTAKLPGKMQQWGLPLLGDVLTQDPLLVDRTLEGGSRYQIADVNLDVYRRPYLKSSEVGRSLMTTIRHLQLSQAMSEIESGFSGWMQPTLIVWGMKDPWLPFSPVQQFANALKNVEIVKLEDGAHYPQEHWSDQISEVLLPFLRRQEL